MPPLVVLFDFDGVIADTENVHIAAWQRTLARLGWELSDETAQSAAELDDRVFLNELFVREKIERGDVEGWLRLKRLQAEQMLADGPRIYPGVKVLVNALSERGIRLAVVTTTWRRNVEIVLESGGLLDSFTLIVAKEDVANVKPAPDGYLLALERLGVTADQAFAIEDSPNGIASAKAAGLRVLAVGHRRPLGQWAGECFVNGLDDFEPTCDQLGLS